VAERLIVSSGVPAITRRRLQNGALILAYHNVIPDGAPPGADVSLHLSRSVFASHLDRLVQTHSVVRLDEAIGGRSRNGKPLAAITFDDAYRGALTIGLEEMRARGLPATIFVAPAFLNDGVFWWDSLDWPAELVEGEQFRARAIDECQGCDAEVRALASHVGYGARDVPDYARCVTEDELARVAADGMVTIGTHSWSHMNLAALSGPALARELGACLPWLRERFATAQPWLAYPYGTWSPAVATAAREAGYTIALLADGGWLREPSDADRLTLPRLNVPAGLSASGFALRAAGLFC
jgi:peptidoglycan/xylan/chitin deacetylase (PgdA/CDA1 family)